jgi:DNA-binding transcriptional MerR regulator
MKTAEQTSGVYRSGVAARLAGVPVDTLRIWERRYAVIGPRQSAGRQRLYSLADIRRLTMIKQLVDTGHPIGTIAALGSDALLAMQAASFSLQDSASRRVLNGEPRETRIALVGPMLVSEPFVQALTGGALKVIGRCPDIAKAVAALREVQADLVIIDLPSVRDADLGRVASIKAACSAATAIVLYRFAPSALVRRLRMAGHAVARATSDPAEVEAVCMGLLRHPGPGAGDQLRMLQAAQPRPPRFDEKFLADVAGLSRIIECECPKHLADLVLNLGGFERYSAECASRSPADVVLHLELQRAAGLARSILEQALESVAIAEGIDLPEQPASQ